MTIPLDAIRDDLVEVLKAEEWGQVPKGTTLRLARFLRVAEAAETLMAVEDRFGVETQPKDWDELNQAWDALRAALDGEA